MFKQNYEQENKRKLFGPKSPDSEIIKQKLSKNSITPIVSMYHPILIKLLTKLYNNNKIIEWILI